jgi:hypothetical protein
MFAVSGRFSIHILESVLGPYIISVNFDNLHISRGQGWRNKTLIDIGARNSRKTGGFQTLGLLFTAKK